MKALELKNIRAREKQLKSDTPQPYHHAYIEYEMYCPHCDSRLRKTENNIFWQECKCSIWLILGKEQNERYLRRLWR